MKEVSSQICGTIEFLMFIKARTLRPKKLFFTRDMEERIRNGRFNI
jgi:hypothetical protein